MLRPHDIQNFAYKGLTAERIVAGLVTSPENDGSLIWEVCSIFQKAIYVLRFMCYLGAPSIL